MIALLDRLRDGWITEADGREAAAEIERLRAVLLSTRQYLEGIENYPEPGDTIKEIDAALGPR